MAKKTKPEIIAELDVLGVEYDINAKRDDLAGLLKDAKAQQAEKKEEAEAEVAAEATQPAEERKVLDVNGEPTYERPNGVNTKVEVVETVPAKHTDSATKEVGSKYEVTILGNCWHNKVYYAKGDRVTVTKSVYEALVKAEVVK
jgi:hypothetical protein